MTAGRLAQVLGLGGLLLAAGCLGQPEPEPLPGPAGAADGTGALQPPPRVVAECANALLFQFVDFATTDPFLPPGFHPRDPQGFLGTPVAFGQAAVVLVALACEGSDVPYEAASLAIFAEAPDVPNVPPAPFNFYELERYAPPGQFGGALDAAGWPRVDGDVEVLVDGETPQAQAGYATVDDMQGEVAFFGGSMGAAVPLEGGLARFWNQGPRGLSYIDHAASLNSLAGPGTCFVREGTTLANLTRDIPLLPDAPPLGTPVTRSPGCPPGEPVVATFPSLAIDASFHHLPGVMAG